MTKEEDEEKRRTTEIKEAKKEEKIEISKIMLKKHIPMKDIIEITELTEEELEKLKNENVV